MNKVKRKNGAGELLRFGALAYNNVLIALACVYIAVIVAVSVVVVNLDITSAAVNKLRTDSDFLERCAIVENIVGNCLAVCS